METKKIFSSIGSNLKLLYTLTIRVIIFNILYLPLSLIFYILLCDNFIYIHFMNSSQAGNRKFGSNLMHGFCRIFIGFYIIGALIFLVPTKEEMKFDDLQNLSELPVNKLWTNKVNVTVGREHLLMHLTQIVNSF